MEKVTHDNELRSYKATLFQHFLALQHSFLQYHLIHMKFIGKQTS